MREGCAPAAPTMSRPPASVYFSTSNPPQLAVLSEQDSAAYLERLDLPASLLREAPSLSLLAQVLLAHHLAVPYDTSSLHVPNSDWNGPSQPIRMGEGGGMELDTRGNFERIVERHRGGFCYSLNTAAAALLRGEVLAGLLTHTSLIWPFAPRLRLPSFGGRHSRLSAPRQGPGPSGISVVQHHTRAAHRRLAGVSGSAVDDRRR